MGGAHFLGAVLAEGEAMECSFTGRDDLAGDRGCKPSFQASLLPTTPSTPSAHVMLHPHLPNFEKMGRMLPQVPGDQWGHFAFPLAVSYERVWKPWTTC